jgi:hypothetical protein
VAFEEEEVVVDDPHQIASRYRRWVQIDRFT